MCCDVLPRLVLLLCAALGGHSAALRPECPPQQGTRCKDYEYNDSGMNIFMIDDYAVELHYMEGSFFELQCDNVMQSAEHPALPRFPELIRVRKVKLRACAIPTLPYARVLAALNVTVTDQLILDELPAASKLRNDHFEGLHSILYLKLNGVVSKHATAIYLPHATLVPMQRLRDLILEHVQAGTVLEALPVSISSLTLRYTRSNLTHALGPRLQYLYVKDEGSIFVNVTRAPALSSLIVASHNSSLAGMMALTSLEKLKIDYWFTTQIEPWVKCDALKYLALMKSASRQQTLLPDGWVARCPLLSELSVRQIPLAPLPSRLLENATAMKILRLSECRLTELPSDLFKDLTQLTLLDLSNNQLQTLPRNLFISLRTLENLLLSNNRLTAMAALALQPLTSLKQLFLVGNTQLSDLCDVETELAVNTSRSLSLSSLPSAGPSKLCNMTGLTTLDLRNTGVSRVCRDWREGMPNLMNLELCNTNITVLRYEDVMQCRNTTGATMKVGCRNKTIRLEYSFEDFKRSNKENCSLYGVDVVIQEVDCNCDAYWAALTFRTGSRHRQLRSPRCANQNLKLRTVPIEKLTCAKPELCINLHGCSCVLSYDTRLDPLGFGLITASCENRGLTSVPGPLPSSHMWRLKLANNSIDSLQETVLPPHLVELDLYNNALKEFEIDAAVALRKRRVRLNNNPLRCDCDALGLLEIVTWPDRIDLTNITCAVDSKLPTLKRMASDCSRPSTSQSVTLITVVLMVLAMVTLSMIMVLTRTEIRLRLEILFRKLGWLPPYPEDEGERDADEGRLFDAFVSYAHEDEEWVRETLVERLEGGPTPFRLCVHYRDWAPGEWIPAQIAASVRASCRTLAVVSRNFLKSDWALLEFREAHAQACRDVTPRLIVVLLEDPELLPLDVEMSGFIESNTYVRWGDPWFWRKLEHAMPRLRKPHILDQSKSSQVPYSRLVPVESLHIESLRPLQQSPVTTEPPHIHRQSPTFEKPPVNNPNNNPRRCHAKPAR